MNEDNRQEALQRFHLLRPHLEDGVPLTLIARQRGLTARTLQRWLRRYWREGLAGLTRHTRADAGHRRLPPDLQHLIKGLALRKPPPSVATVHRRAAAVAQEHGWRVPSYDCVHDVVRALDPALITLAHEGPKVYGEQFDLVVRREASAPNEVWQADHTPLDLWIRDDDGQPAKPWLTVVLDDFSRAVAGYALSLQAPSALQTALALRQAIWRKSEPGWHVCGVPGDFYTDHGSDFTSRHLEQVAADLHMRLVFSLPGAPRGRGKIERFFGTVNTMLLAALPGYTPAGTAPPTEPTLTLSELDDHLRAFIVDDYHRRPHSETGEPPQARWETHGFLPRVPDTLEQLDLLLLTVAKTRRVQRDGIHFAGLRFIDPTLAAYVGDDVMIRYDPRDIAEIRVFRGDAFLCRAVCQELAGQTVGFKEVIKARNERRRGLRAELEDQPSGPETPPPDTGPRLKRYVNE